jgi:hypothetical protein
VHIDGDTSLRGHITALCWRSEDGHTVEVSRMYNGISYAAWFQAWRLILVDTVRRRMQRADQADRRDEVDLDALVSR